MDICTIVEFREALTHPQQYFKTLKNIKADIESIRRSRNFVECSAYIDDRKALIYAPITPKATTLVHGAIAALNDVESPLKTEMELYSCEMQRMNGERCSIIVEWPLHGTPLSKSVYTLSCQRLIAELDKLRHTLQTNNISINNLKAENIIVDNLGRWHIVRQYYATSSPAGDDAAINEIRLFIEKNALADIDTCMAAEPFSGYDTRPRLVEHRRKIEQNGLIGFVDENDKLVIECQYIDATNFIEHRSVVTLMDHRVGVIDIDGNAIIEAKYDAIKYDVESGESWAFHGDKAAKFDYLGKQLTAWRTIDDLDVEI